MEPRLEIRARERLTPATFKNTGEALAWLGGLVLALSSFMGWYSVSVGSYSLGEESSLSLLGWHSGVLGKLVFFVGLAVLVLLTLRATGYELPPSVPSGMVIAGLGALGTVFVVVRLIDLPDDYSPIGRSIGIWISLLAALLLIGAGLLRSADEI
jgi:hypothetical protein